MRGETKRKKARRRTAGEFGLTIEEAGAMVGLTRSAAYRAAKAGQIPAIRAGRCLVVPKAIWLRQLGIEPAAEPAAKPAAKRKTASQAEAA